MGSSDQYFVEWKEQFLQRRGDNRVVNYFLKDLLGESVLVVFGTKMLMRLRILSILGCELVHIYAFKAA